MHLKKIGARVGYPGKLMPHVTEPMVAVNLHKMTPEGGTVVAEVCVPMNLGVTRCEQTAKKVVEAMEKQGFSMTYGSHRFDGKSGLYQTSIYGYLPRPAEEEAEV